MRKTLLFAFLMHFFGLFTSCGLIDGDNPKNGGGITIPSPIYPQAYAGPSVSPDSSRLLFVRNKVTKISKSGSFTIDPDSSGIWVAKSDGSNMNLLIQSQNVGTPSFSPDMEWILFEGGAQIYKVPFAGDSVNMDNLVQLTFEGRNFFPDWSPDGEWIAYDNTNCGSSSEPLPENSCGIIVIDKNGSSRKLIARGRMPDWSSDNENIVYVGLENEIYVLNISDKSELRLTTSNQLGSNPVSNYTPKYFPSDSLIAFQANLQIKTISFKGELLKLLTNDGGVEPAWTPDGQIIYIKYSPHTYDANNGTIWLMNMDGSQKRQLTFNYDLNLEKGKEVFMQKPNN